MLKFQATLRNITKWKNFNRVLVRKRTKLLVKLKKYKFGDPMIISKEMLQAS